MQSGQKQSKYSAEALAPADLRALVENGRELASCIDLRTLLAKILTTAGDMTDSPDGSVFLYDKHRHGLYFAAATGDAAPKLLEEWGEESQKRVPIAGSKAGQVFESGESLVEDTLQQDRTHFKGIDSTTKSTSKSMVCVPLAIVDMLSGEREPLGAIQILNKRSGAYNERDLVLLESFASQAAVAIRNARLFKDLLSQRGLYSKQDSLELMELLSRPPAPEELTVMMPDMRGFTQLLQSMHNAMQMHELMGQYLTMLADETLRADGVVNKVLGDGILAFFRGKDGPRRAVSAAFAMLARFDELKRQWDEVYSQDLAFLNIGIGIATGEVTVGTLGSGSMRDFTIMGVPVNLATAYQSEARHGKRILVDQRTYLGAKEMIGESLGPFTFELHKPDQDLFVRYRQYQLISLQVKTPVVEEEDEPVIAGQKLRVFLCHSSGDKPAVRGLYARLREDGFDPWLDEENLIPGQDWQLEIKRAVKAASAVIVCLSRGSVSKEGYLQRELRNVLDVADEKPDGTIFVIPAKLEDCDLPERLHHLHYVELCDPGGYPRLKKALDVRAGN